jgi:hypothetical protein
MTMGKKDEATEKFFSLRKSGWKGPIDRKGDAVMTETDNKGNPKPLFGDGKKKGE